MLAQIRAERTREQLEAWADPLSALLDKVVDVRKYVTSTYNSRGGCRLIPAAIYQVGDKLRA